MSRTTTNAGIKLRSELNDALRADDGTGSYIPLSMSADVSLLARRAKRYNTRQEQACSYEWACGDAWDLADERLEKSIVALATSLPGVVGVKFGGDPRGFTVRLVLDNGRTNDWAKEGFGIA